MSKLSQKMVKLGINPKREILTIILSVVAILGTSIGLGLILNELVYIAIGAGCSFIFVLYNLTKYNNIENKINADNLQEFSIIFGYFRIYIRNGYSVYSALNEIQNFACPSIKKMLETLINEIDEDKTVQPFINFSANFTELIVKEMMISIYQMIDDGEQSNYLTQFETIFDKFSDLLHQKNLKKRDSNLASSTSTPLIGSCYLIIVLAIGIIGIIGEMINGF